MLILSRVCVSFHDKQGGTLFRVTPAERLTFVEAPEAIRQEAKNLKIVYTPLHGTGLVPATRVLKELGFEVVDSNANFVFAKHPSISGQEIYEKLKANGVLVRHFTKGRIKEYNRITIGTKEQMDVLFGTFRKIWG